MRQFSRLFHQAVAGITKPVTLHFLRHSFAARDTLQASAHRSRKLHSYPSRYIDPHCPDESVI